MADGPTQLLWGKLVSLVRRRAGPGVDAEDLVQEAYARLVEQQRKACIDNPEGFVLRAASNLAVSTHRARASHGAAHADVAVAAILRPQWSPQDEVIAARERLRIVEQAIDELPPRTREVFVLHRIEGMKYSEIARALDISVSAVEKNMARALAHLTLKISDFGRRR